MSWAAAVLMLTTGVFLPTLDAYSDLWFVGWLFQGNYYADTSEFENVTLCYYNHPQFGQIARNHARDQSIRAREECRYHSCEELGRAVPSHPRFGSIMLIPLLLSWVLVTQQWYKMESGMKRKLKTLPLLVLQVYPQWRALRVLYYAKWKKHIGWQEMKEEWETGITHIGKHQMRS